MSTLTEEQERKEREEREEEIRKKKEKEHLEHCKVLSGHLASLVNNKENYDVTFLVGNLDEGESLERIYAHRAILAARRYANFVVKCFNHFVVKCLEPCFIWDLRNQIVQRLKSLIFQQRHLLNYCVISTLEV